MRLLALLLALTTCAPARAGDEPCAELVRRTMRRLQRSAFHEFALQLQADRTTRTIVDSLGRSPKIGPEWREGNPHWEQAYALFLPDVVAHLRAVGQLEVRDQEARLPGLLRPSACAERLALVGTPQGELAERLEAGVTLGAMQADMERHFRPAERVRPWADRAREEAAREAGLAESPEVKAQPALFQKTRAQLRALDKEYMVALDRLGDSRGEKEREASRGVGQEMLKRHEPRLLEIMRAFAAARPR